MPNKVTKAVKDNPGKTGIAVIGCAILIVALVLAGQNAGWLGAGATTTPTVYDDYQISLWDAFDSSEDNYELDNSSAILWYRANIENLDSEEISDLTWSDFTYVEADDNQDQDDKYEWIVKIAHTGFVNKYLVTNALLFEGKCPLLALGPNDVFLVNQSEDVSMLAYGKDSLDNTIASTTEANWMVMAQSLDGAEGTGEGTELEGFAGYYDPENAVYQRLTIKIQYNTTASNSYCRLLSSYVNVESSAGNFSFISIDAVLFNQMTFEIKFSAAALNSTVAVVKIFFGYGNSDSFTEWDNQV